MAAGDRQVVPAAVIEGSDAGGKQSSADSRRKHTPETPPERVELVASEEGHHSPAGYALPSTAPDSRAT